MKIGFSFSKCVRDILSGKVQEDEVVCIISRTIVDPEHFEALATGYGSGGGRGYLQDFSTEDVVALAKVLWDSGRLHQPRKFNKTCGVGVPDEYAWMDLVPTNLSDNPSVEAAWKNYRMLLKLANGQFPDDEAAEQHIRNPHPAW